MSLENSGMWLSNEGYNLVLLALKKLKPSDDGLTKDILLSEKHLIELILHKNQLETHTHLKDIPGINTIYNLSPLISGSSKGNFHIEIKGMPRSGKDTLISRIDSIGHKKVICTKEPYTSIKDWKKNVPQDSLTQQHLQLAAMFGEFIAGEVIARTSNIENGAIIIHNRGITDNPALNRAKLLYGEVPIKDYYHPEEGWIFRSTMKMDAVIIFMQNPQVSISRSLLEETRSRRHVTKGFLTLLYEQYLREIVELRNKNQKNLLVMDTSNDIETNFEFLRKNLSTIIGENI